MDDIIVNKSENIERCIARIRATYQGNAEALETDYTVQDVLVLNLQRACESAIDMAMYIVKIKKLGVPKDSREAFTLLAKAQLIPKTISARLENMVGFRNVIVHEYTNIDYAIVKSVITHELDTLLSFCKIILRSA